MRICYLITCCNETDTLKELLSQMDRHWTPSDEMLIVQDSKNGTDETKKIINDFVAGKSDKNINYLSIPLNNNYSEYKNSARKIANDLSIKNNGSICEYVFQLDGDECPCDNLLESVHEVVEANPDVEVFLVPRINDFLGVTPDHARQWGWTLNPYKDRVIVNFPDFQFRLFANKPHIRWERPLHEKIEGALTLSKLPDQFDWAIHHNKTIEKQVQTNLRYNKDFSPELNQGFKI